MGIKRPEPPPVHDDFDDTYLGRYYEDDDEVRDDKGNEVPSLDLVIGDKAVRLFFKPENHKKVSLKELLDIAREAAEDPRYAQRYNAAVEKEARKRGGSSTSGGNTRRQYGAGTKRNDTKHIREWLRSQGVEISNRGRVPDDLMARYNAAHPGEEYTPPPAATSTASSEERSAAATVRNAAPAPADDDDDDDGEDFQALLDWYNKKHKKKLTAFQKPEQEAEARAGVAAQELASTGV